MIQVQCGIQGTRQIGSAIAIDMLIDIALDAVGSDKAPEPEIRGAILACSGFACARTLDRAGAGVARSAG